MARTVILSLLSFCLLLRAESLSVGHPNGPIGYDYLFPVAPDIAETSAGGSGGIPASKGSGGGRGTGLNTFSRSPSSGAVPVQYSAGNAGYQEASMVPGKSGAAATAATSEIKTSNTVKSRVPGKMKPMGVPAWLQKLMNSIEGITGFLESLKIPVPPAPPCGERMIDLKVCTLDQLVDLLGIFATAVEAVKLNARVLAGGRGASKSLARLHSLYSKPFAKQILTVTGTPMLCRMLVMKELTPDRLRSSCLSIITLLTDLPAGEAIEDVQTGGFYHLNLMLPRASRVQRADKVLRQLRAGVDPIDLVEGPWRGEEGRDDI